MVTQPEYVQLNLEYDVMEKSAMIEDRYTMIISNLEENRS